MNLVCENRNEANKPIAEKDGVLKTWLMANSTNTIKKFKELEENNFQSPLKFNSNTICSYNIYCYLYLIKESLSHRKPQF